MHTRQTRWDALGMLPPVLAFHLTVVFITVKATKDGTHTHKKKDETQ
jgi:hypothetical protein